MYDQIIEILGYMQDGLPESIANYYLCKEVRIAELIQVLEAGD